MCRLLEYVALGSKWNLYWQHTMAGENPNDWPLSLFTVAGVSDQLQSQEDATLALSNGTNEILSRAVGYQQNSSVDRLQNWPMNTSITKAAMVIKECKQKEKEFIGRINETQVKTTVSVWYFRSQSGGVKMQEVSNPTLWSTTKILNCLGLVTISSFYKDFSKWNSCQCGPQRFI